MSRFIELISKTISLDGQLLSSKLSKKKKDLARCVQGAPCNIANKKKNHRKKIKKKPS